MKNWPVFRLIGFDHCRTLAPWCAVRSGSTPLLRIRRLAYELEQADLPRRSKWEAGLAQLLYLPLSLRQIFIVWRPEFRGTRAHYRVGYLRQWFDLIRLTWRGNLPPRLYYYCQLFRPGREDYLAVIEHRELQVLLRALHAHVDTSVLLDKVAFHDFCRENGLATPAILATYADGKPQRVATSPTAGKTDVFSKPASGFNSEGVACWRYRPATDTYSDGKVELGFTALQEWFAAQSHNKTLIVQPRLDNAPELASLGLNSLANCRLVTARRADDRIMLLMAAFRMGLGGTITSDNPTVTFCAAVNLETGILGPAETKQAARGSFTHHPESGAPVAGRALPRWKEMCEMAVRAHSALPHLQFIGWDIVDTSVGPMLLEGNLIWGGNLAQMSGNPALGATEFPALFIHHYESMADRTASAASDASLRVGV